MAVLLDVSPDVVRRLAESGDSPAVRAGRFWRTSGAAPDEPTLGPDPQLLAALHRRRVIRP